MLAPMLWWGFSGEVVGLVSSLLLGPGAQERTGALGFGF